MLIISEKNLYTSFLISIDGSTSVKKKKTKVVIKKTTVTSS